MYSYVHGGNAIFQSDMKILMDLSANINPIGFPKVVEEAIKDEIQFCTRYPDNYSTELRKKISEYENIDIESIFCSNGASDIIFRLPQAIKPKKALILAPTFSDYERAIKSFGGEVVYYYLSEESGFQLDQDICATIIEERVDMVFICNPNNPTGVLTSQETIKAILDVTRDRGIYVVVDECFIDFVDNMSYYTAKPFLHEYKNLVILKAFTKIFALPGLRLGYAFSSDPDLIEKLYYHGADWPVSNFAQGAGIAALENAKKFIQDTVKFVTEERAYVTSELSNLGFKVFSSQANYIFFKNPFDYDLKEKLLKHGINIRSCSNFNGLNNSFYRIAVSSRENNRFIISKIKGRRSLMVLGTSSGAGKSTVVTGLCRVLYQDGNNVAPFKAQNITDNTYIFDTGLRIAKSQAIAASACNTPPSVYMNPIALKLQRGKVEVLVCGKSIGEMSSKQYSDLKSDLLPQVISAYDKLQENHEVIVLEGAGSPVEMNLKSGDIVNMKVAREVCAPVILVADIDRGGSFASVYGTLMLLDDIERSFIKGVVINRLKGQKESFNELKVEMEKVTGIPVVGMIPYMPIRIEDEDNLIDENTGQKPMQTAEDMEKEFNLLAESFREHMDMPKIYEILDKGISL